MASTSETGLQLFARLIPRPSLLGLDSVLFPEGPNPKEVIEISGESSCGKTLLLSQFIVKSILPKEVKNVHIGGLKVGVVLLNTDHHFQMYKLMSLMENRLQAVQCFNTSDVEEIVKYSLKRLIIYNICDSDQLKMTFYALQTLVSNRPEIGLILLDSVCAFYWQDAMASGIRKMDLYAKTIVKSLQKAVSDFKGIIMYTRPVYFQSKLNKFEVTPGLGYVDQKIVLKRTVKDNVFCADVQTPSRRGTKMFSIDSAGLNWIE